MGARGSQDLRSQSPIMAPAWSKHTSKYSRRKRGRGSDHVAKNARKNDMEQQPIPIKRPVFNKQPSLISSTRKIRETDVRYTQVRSADLFLFTTWLYPRCTPWTPLTKRSREKRQLTIYFIRSALWEGLPAPSSLPLRKTLGKLYYSTFVGASCARDEPQKYVRGRLLYR